MASQAEALSGDRHGEGNGGGGVRRGGQGLALATLCTVLFLTFLDNTVVSVALGDIQTSLHATVSDLSGSSAPTPSPSPASCWPAG